MLRFVFHIVHKTIRTIELTNSLFLLNSVFFSINGVNFMLP